MDDRARIYVEGGRGGDGCVSFRREAHVPKGGPDGGDGGHGGDVLLVCDPSRRDLAALRHSAHFRAGRGRHGEGKNKHGARGADETILVAPGTQVTALDGSRVDLVEPGQRTIVAAGGRGGHGNKRFATSTRRTPRFSEKGTTGESGWIELRLKLLADAGLIGMPNAGKSSLLARLTRATPKVADYPFTTVEPALGTIEDEDRQVVLADIPGLIEGAGAGAGLGHEFLAHAERCAMLVHLVEIVPLAGDAEANYEAVRAELGSYGGGLDELPELLVLSKADLITDEERGRATAAWSERLGDRVVDVIVASSVTGAGLDEVRRRILTNARQEQAPAGVSGGTAPSPRSPEFEVEHRVYRPVGEGGYRIEREDDRIYRVVGRGVEMLIDRHDLSNQEALAYLEQRLTEMGVVAALHDAGFEPGDEVRIGEHEFDLHPVR